MDVYILDDDSLKNKNKVKKTLIRFIFVNIGIESKKFKALIKDTKNMTNMEKITTPNPKVILDKVESRNISSFHSIYRLRGDLPFIKNENTGITIDFND